MQKLSDQTRHSLSELDTPSWITRLLSRQAEARVEILAQIAESNELATIPRLIGHLLDSEIALPVSLAIHSLLGTIESSEYVALDNAVRRISHAYYTNAWARLQSTQFSRLPLTNTTETSLLGIASFHADGHVRQQAVRRLGERNDPAALPFLLIRLNDWVAQVRYDASQAVRQFLQRSLEPFVANLFLVFRLLDCGRTYDLDLVGDVVRRLTQAEYREHLLAALADCNPFVRRTCFRLTSEIEGEHLPDLILSGIQSDDLVIRVLAANRVDDVISDQDLPEVLTQMEQDRSMPVRREALRLRVSRSLDKASPDTSLPAAVINNLEIALLDQSFAMREEARFHLKKVGRSDFAPFYRDALSTGRNIPAAIAGLGETGNVDDIELILDFLASDRPALRKATIRVIGKLGAEGHIETLLAQLNDTSPKVVMEAAKVLSDWTHQIEVDDLREIFRSSPQWHVKRSLLVLLSHFRIWRVLPCLLQAAEDNHQAIAEMAQAYIERCYNQVFTQPNETETQAIGQAINQATFAEDSRFAAHLRAWLKAISVEF